MERKHFFFYGIFFIGSLIGVLWFLGGAALQKKSLAFNREDAEKQILAGTGIALGDGKNTQRVVAGIVSAYRQVVGNETVQDPAAIEQVLKEKLGSALAENVAPITAPSITTKDIKVVPNTGENEMAYARGIAAITRKTYYEGLSQELDVFNNTFVSTATAEEKKAGREALVRAAATYKTIAEDLVKLSVPERQAQKTVALVNGYLLLSVGSELLAHAFTDPVSSLQGIQVYAQGYLSLKNL
jgi:hypothetical protein